MKVFDKHDFLRLVEIPGNKIYAGIGSRRTPRDVLGLMEDWAIELARLGYTLRSGGAEGADLAFEAGARMGGGDAEIWLPFPRYNGHDSPLIPSMAAFDMAAKFHPAWGRCSPIAKAMHARNCHQVMGADLNTPVDFVLYWTAGGEAKGGTGQALRIAKHFGIPMHWMILADSGVKNET